MINIDANINHYRYSYLSTSNLNKSSYKLFRCFKKNWVKLYVSVPFRSAWSELSNRSQPPISYISINSTLQKKNINFYVNKCIFLCVGFLKVYFLKYNILVFFCKSFFNSYPQKPILKRLNPHHYSNIEKRPGSLKWNGPFCLIFFLQFVYLF